jgi:hypothetical protein
MNRKKSNRGRSREKKGRQEIYGGRHRLQQGIYAVTSHSSLGQTADLVLIHIDTEKGAKDLLSNRMAYVAVSRGAYDAQIFTNDREKLGAALGHDVSHSSAHAPEMKPEQKQEQAVTPQREIAPKQEQEQSLDIGLGL